MEQPQFRVNPESGQLEEAVFQPIGDEASLQAEVERTEAELTDANEAHVQAQEVHANAEAVAEAALDDLELKRTAKEAAETAHAKSSARANAAAEARRMAAEQPVEDEPEDTDDDTEESDEDGSILATDAQDVPVHVSTATA